MGIIEVDRFKRIIRITSAIISYGNAADYTLTRQLTEEMEMMWNEPNGRILLNNRWFQVQFRIMPQFNHLIQENSIRENNNPKNNYIRIEEFSKINISCVDAVGSNSGYFKLDNLYPGSTTASHEYGHSLGLDHPHDLNLVGKGVPGIMYPRGTLVDPEFQYDKSVKPGEGGGTLNPIYRKVKQADIEHLQLDKLLAKDIYTVGKFTNKYHEAHVKEI